MKILEISGILVQKCRCKKIAFLKQFLPNCGQFDKEFTCLLQKKLKKVTVPDKNKAKTGKNQ